MDTLEKLTLLSENMRLEPAEEVRPSGVSACGAIDRVPSKDHPGIFHASAPGGPVPLLKTLLTSVCERNCYYCPFRAGRDFRRTSFKPDEMADLFTTMHRRGYVDGLFLSSGIAGGGVRVQDRLIDTVDILRRRKRFTGYIHLKLIPGADKDQVIRAMQLADRVSINLEAPNPARLKNLAPLKNYYEELMRPLIGAEEIRRQCTADKAFRGRWPSLTTQFVVGAVGETDLELMATSARLFSQLRLARIYYSAFDPVTDTPLENLAPESPVRQARLYQASFLLRDYEFDLEDLPFQPNGSLPLDKDPKLAWAEQNLRGRPLEINKASRHELLRVPGIGPKFADAVISARRAGPLRRVEDLRAAGIQPDRALPFILLNGKRPAYQPGLW